MKYRSREPDIVDAVQFVNNLDCLAEIEKLCAGEQRLAFSDKGTTLFIDTCDETLGAHIGDYIVKSYDVEINIYTSDEFEKLYEPLETNVREALDG